MKRNSRGHRFIEVAVIVAVVRGLLGLLAEVMFRLRLLLTPRAKFRSADEDRPSGPLERN